MNSVNFDSLGSLGLVSFDGFDDEESTPKVKAPRRASPSSNSEGGPRGRRPMSPEDRAARTVSTTSNGVKQSFYLPLEVVNHLQEVAQDLDRSMSWVLRACLSHSLEHVRTGSSLASSFSDESDEG